nr:9804_t:CDS:2 [Entrophospora candida]
MLSSENESTYNVGTSVEVKPNEEEKGNYGTPGIGKTHFAIYFAFYITHWYSADITFGQLVIGTDRSFTFCIKQNKNVIQISDMMGE